MECYEYDGQELKKRNRIMDFSVFHELEQEIISVIGAGGKTAFVYELAGELLASGKRVVVTTTTHMMKPACGFIEWTECRSVAWQIRQVQSCGQIPVVGIVCENGKIRGVPRQAYGALADLTDILLAEADGSRKRPLKIPAAHEPVMYPGTGITVGVAGCDCLEQRIEEAVQRPEEMAAFLGKAQAELITMEDLCNIIRSENGMFCRSRGEKVLFLNKVKDLTQMKDLKGKLEFWWKKNDTNILFGLKGCFPRQK